MSADYSEIQKLIDEDVLQSVPDEKLVKNKLGQLIDSGFLKRTSDTDYIFKDQVTWEIVYETLLYSERRHFHDLIARHIEKNKKNNLSVYAAKLLYHYDKGENDKKVVFYAALAGDRAYELFSIDDAIELYNKALSRLIIIKKYPKNDCCLLLEKKADVMESIADFSEAIELYKTSLNILDNKTSSRRTLLPWKLELKKKNTQISHKLSAVYEKIMDFDNAFNFLDKAEESLPSRPGIFREKIYATRSVVYFRKMDFDNSIKYAQSSLKSAKKIKSYSGIAYANNILANIYTNTGQHELAIASFENALDTYRSINDLNGIAISCINIGVALNNIYRLEESNKYLEESLSVNKKLQNKLSIMYCYLMLGINHLLFQNLKESLELLDKVVLLYEGGIKRDDIYGVALSKIAEVYLKKNELDKSEQYLKKSVSILSALKEMPDKLQQAKIIMAQLFIKQHKYDEAEQVCYKLLDDIPDDKSIAMRLFIMRLLGAIYRDMEKYEQAKKVLSEAVKLSEASGAEHEKYCIQNILYDIEARVGNVNSGLLKQIEYILDKFKEKNDTEEIKKSENTIALIKEKLNK